MILSLGEDLISPSYDTVNLKPDLGFSLCDILNVRYGPNPTNLCPLGWICLARQIFATTVKGPPQ